MLKVHVAWGGGIHSAKWLPVDVSLVSSVKEADLVIFTGGGDISPSIYNETCHGRNWYYERDREEVEVFDDAISLGKPMIGICRGAQLICAKSGGRLVQDLNHPGGHMLKTTDSEFPEVLVNSIHHQLMYPFEMNKKEYEILAYTPNISKHHYDGEGNQMELTCEPEIVLFPKSNALGFQCHPEMIGRPDKGSYQNTVKYFDKIVKNFLNIK